MSGRVIADGAAARAEVLGRVRAALRDVPANEQPGQVAVERGYRRGSQLPRAQIVDMFAERVADYKARVRRVAADELAAVISETAAGRRLVVPAGLPPDWWQGLDVRVDGGTAGVLTVADLDAAPGVLTGAAIGIAETGTIVLDAGPRCGRRLISLVPDYHLCVVEADQVLGTVPEAIAALTPTAPLTFISGPSATSDIELIRVEGVHGPRTLDVLVVE
ncbi:MAG: LutC/YkgG family protein [Blastococcus sp.]|jgi:L-lactate dehydrogenase complex protein LldG